MTRTGADAIAYARSRVGGTTPEGSGYCLAFTRQCFDVAAYYASAIDAAQAATYPHPGDWDIPPATPVYFSSASVYDHVAFYVSDAEVITTWTDRIYSWPMSRMTSDFGPFRGWAEDINTVRVYAAAPPDQQVGDDVARLLVHPNGTVALAGPGAAFQVLHSSTQMEALQATGQATGDLIRLPDPLIWNTAVQLAQAASLYTP